MNIPVASTEVCFFNSHKLAFEVVFPTLTVKKPSSKNLGEISQSKTQTIDRAEVYRGVVWVWNDP